MLNIKSKLAQLKIGFKFMLTILITLGPTREYIDPVRFISNASSGKMGCEIIQQALKKKCKVIAVKGPCDISIKKDNCKVVDVVTTEQMFKAVKDNLKKTDIFIGSAAVADYRPVKTQKNKIKKSCGNLTLTLVKNVDIISYVSKHKTKKQIVIGFALESKSLIPYAKEKLNKKNLDMVIANGIKTIGSNVSEPTILFKSGNIKKMKSATKKYIAKEIINEAIKLFSNNKIG